MIRILSLHQETFHLVVAEICVTAFPIKIAGIAVNRGAQVVISHMIQSSNEIDVKKEFCLHYKYILALL